MTRNGIISHLTIFAAGVAGGALFFSSYKAPARGQVPLRLAHRTARALSPEGGGAPPSRRAATTTGGGPARFTPDRSQPAPVDNFQSAISNSQFLVTAYCPCRICCGKFADGITASGEPVTANPPRAGFVAAPPEIPFGTLVSIPGYAGGQKVPVLDRGGRIKGRRLDVYFPTHAQALRWGVKRCSVRIFNTEAQR